MADLFALAALAFTSARSHEADEPREVNLHAALATREVIGQAQGVLIERERIAVEEAFDIVGRASQHLNVKLRDVAHTLADTRSTQIHPTAEAASPLRGNCGGHLGRGVTGGRAEFVRAALGLSACRQADAVAAAR